MSAAGQASPLARLRLSLRVHGPLDGLLIWSARIVQKRVGYRAAWPLWEASNRLENFWLQRHLRELGF